LVRFKTHAHHHLHLFNLSLRSPHACSTTGVGLRLCLGHCRWPARMPSRCSAASMAWCWLASAGYDLASAAAVPRVGSSQGSGCVARPTWRYPRPLSHLLHRAYGYVPVSLRWGHSGDGNVSLPRLFPLANAGELRVGLVTLYQALYAKPLSRANRARVCCCHLSESPILTCSSCLCVLSMAAPCVEASVPSPLSPLNHRLGFASIPRTSGWPRE
jgi:hypothetical protein